MGWLGALGQQVRELLLLPPPLVLNDPTPPAAAATSRPIDQAFAEMFSSTTGRVSREQALSVSAVQRGRNALCSIATLPLVQYKGLDIVESPLLRQIDPDVANVVTLSQTIEDLAFDGISWWLITAQDFAGFPLAARHLDVATVSLDPPKGQPNPFPSGRDPRGVKIVWVAGVATPADKLIRFDSPNPGLLRANARAIRRALLLDRLATTYADNPRPLDYFTDSDDPSIEPMAEDEIDPFLAEWQDRRKARSTAWIPGNVRRVDVSTPSPAEVQLVQLQQQVTLEIANGLGVDPEDLGVSTTSRTYFNAADRRMTKINETYAPYMSAITQRLSMGDVTRRGYSVRFDLTDYLKPDPAGQVAYWRGLYDMDAIDSDEVRAFAQVSGPAPKAKAAPAETPAGEEPAAAAEQVDAARLAGMRFDGPSSALTFDADVIEFSVDRESRTIEGLALPYGKTAQKYGLGFRFERGALRWADPGRVKLLRDHDFRQAIGKGVELTDTPRGLKVKFSVAPNGAGDEALALAEHGTLDGMSVGVDFDVAADTVPDPKDKKTVLVRRADLREVSLTAVPAFDDARVSKVRAQRDHDGGTFMPCATCGQVHAEGVACTASTPTSLATAELTATAAAPAAPAPGALTLSSEQLAVILSRPDGLAGLAALLTPGAPAAPATVAAVPEQRQTVDPTRSVALAQVNEPAPYRFDGRGNIMRGAHDFSTDLIAGLKDGDKAAYDRALSVVQERFDVGRVFDTDRADTAGLNPTRPRQDLYVDQRSYRYPIWDAISKGSLVDVTPFVFPKFNTASGLVSNHTEGTEPTPGTFTVTTQTVTPTAVSGKAEITREVWDQGGNPQVSGLIWRQMEKGWYEALEAAAVAVLDAATPTGIALTAGVKDDVLADELTAAMVLLQFVRGGFSMDNLFTQVDLYKALAAAEDTTGRALFPALGPANANGTARARWSALDINGIAALPAWALAASGSVVASSYLFDSESVHGWASAPSRLTFEYQVKSIDIAIWGYKATAISDLAGVREITYDPVA